MLGPAQASGGESMTALVEAALMWAGNGFPVFPCRPADKAPFTKHSFYDATTDAEQIRRWWAQHPDALIGMPTGLQSGIAVLDLDLKKGKDGLAAVPDHELLTHVQVRTRSGGLHLY